MPYEEFKLDGASLADSDQPLQRIITYHFNVPSRLTADRATFETIRDRITEDFPASPLVIQIPYFQISAVYILIHKDTGLQRLWTGSANSRSRELGQVTPFRHFNPETFVDFVYERSQPDFILGQQQNVADQKETSWTVGEVLAAIVSVQTTVRLSHPVFDRYPELRGYGPARRAPGGRRNAKMRRSVFRIILG